MMLHVAWSMAFCQSQGKRRERERWLQAARGFDSCEGVNFMNHLVMSPPGQSVACSLFNVIELA